MRTAAVPVTGNSRQGIASSSSSSAPISPSGPLPAEGSHRNCRPPLGNHVNGSHLLFPNGMYCGDSDEDSGIGHSNGGGQGDRVGSTSSAEAEVAVEFSGPPRSVVHRWSQPRMGTFGLSSATRPLPPPQQQQPQGPFPSERGKPQPMTVPRSCDQSKVPHKVHPFLGPVQMPPSVESSISSDDVFPPFRAWLNRNGGGAGYLHHHHHRHGGPSTVVGRNSSSNWCQRDVDHGRLIGLVTRSVPPHPLHDPRGGPLGYGPKKDQPLPSGDPPVYGHSGCRSRPGDAAAMTRAWSYSGHSNRYANNVYENAYAVGRGPMTAAEQMLSVRARPVSLGAAHRFAGSFYAGVGAPSWAALQDDCCCPGRLQRARSSSIASLITIDSDLVRVHASPAAVIPASEAGDSLSESFYGAQQTNAVVPPVSRSKLQYRSFPGCYESVTLDNAHRLSLARPPSPPVVHSSPKDSSRLRSLQLQQPAVEHNGEVEYAQVKKPKKKSKSFSNGNTGGKVVEESEPPLPPRNYRRNLVKNGRMTASRSSLAEKVQDFTRSAKQVLRKAFSLDGLNRRSSSSERSASRNEWDVDSDWGERRRTAAVSATSKPRTPAAVKARDADRDRRCVSSRKISMTLC